MASDPSSGTPAPLRLRALAAAVDFLFVTAAGMVLDEAVGVVLLAGLGVPPPSGLYPVSVFLGGWVYLVVVETRCGGRSIGKLGAGLRVVRLEGDLDILWSSVRYVAKVAQLLFGRGLLFGVVLLDDRRRGLHDYLADTLVVVDDPSHSSAGSGS